MKRSAEILLQPLSGRIAIILGSAFFSFYLGMVGMTPLVPAFVIGVLVLVAVGILDRTLLIGRYIFPITPRQIAWIPRGTFTLAMAASCVTFMPSLLVRQQSSFGDVLGSWAFATMLLLIIGRILSRWPNSIFGWLIFMINMVRIPENHELPLSGILLPVWLGGTFLLFHESPYYEAMVRRLDHQAEKYAYSIETTGPARPPAITRLADIFTIGIGLAILLPIFLEEPVGKLSLFAGLLVLGYFMLRFNRASGMTWSRAVGVLVLELTIIGYVFRDRLGVLHGSPVQCEGCKKLKMAWMGQCPHCRSLPNDKSGDSFVTPVFTDYFESALGPTFFRVLVPTGLILWIMARNWNLWFQ